LAPCPPGRASGIPGRTGGFCGDQPTADAKVFSHDGGFPVPFGTGLVPPAASPVVAGAGTNGMTGLATVNAGLAPGPIDEGTEGATEGATEDFTVSPSLRYQSN